MASSQKSTEMTGFFLKTHNNKENGRGDNHNDILEAEKKPNLMAAVSKSKNKIKHPQKATPCTLGTRHKRELKYGESGKSFWKSN